MKTNYSKLKVIIILTMLSMMGLLASDIYLPAMDTMMLHFQTSEVNIQITIGIYLLGLAIFQLIYGPLADQIGRRPIIIFGIIFYILGSLGCSVAPSMHTLIIFRFIQAIGACSGLVLGRVLIADIFPSNIITNIYNIIYPLVAASPAIAPIIGGYLVTYLGWEANFIFISIFGFVLLSLFINFPETLNHKKKFSVQTLITDYIDIAHSIKFWGLVAIICCVYSVWFIYLTQSPFIFLNNLNYPPREVGYFYVPLALSIYLGNLLSKAIKRHNGIEFALYVGCGFFLVGACLLYASLNFFNINTAWQLIIPMSLLAMSNGFILPLGIPAAISLKKGKAGSASGLVGFFQIFLSAACSSLIAKMLGTSAFIMSLSILILSIVSIIFYLLTITLSKIKIQL